ncbi:MAG: phosphorybosylanthranilate isomerase [Actinobacteria bacterium]|nr:MAG: phosphorybosylanthranilate isomerase [Actinomycetota bacterium]
MIHLDPLPGSPGFRSMDAVITKALEDASTLADAGFPALMVENFGDAPFFADSVPSETVAAMTRCVDALIAGTGLPVGVNVLRNDALSAMGIAAATGAPLIRVNVLSGVMYTDQGPIVGKSAELLRKRAELGASTEIWADVLVKHATPPPGADIRQIAVDTLERAGADAVIVTGRGTGSSPEIDHLKTVREAIGPGTRLVVGSGANPTNVADLAAIANTLIVGSATKRDGSPTNPVDPKRADQIAHAAARAGLI